MNVTFLDHIVEPYDELDLQKKIERCFRMCYKSEDHIKEGSEAFLTGLIHNDHPNKHWSPLEHARVVIGMPSWMSDSVYWYNYITDTSFLHVEHTDAYEVDEEGKQDNITKITGNFRAWLEFLTCKLSVPVSEENTFKKARNEIYLALSNTFPYIFKKDEKILDGTTQHVTILRANDYQTFRIVTTRDILQELARHRSLSFSVESTRYCNYGKKGMSFTLPEPYEWSKGVELINSEQSPEDYVRARFNQDHMPSADGTGCYTRINDMFESVDAMNNMKDLYLASVAFSSALYNRALALGIKPQEARMLLPGSLKSELMVTGTFKAWRHFVNLRDDQAAHPQIRILAKMIRESLDINHPGWDTNQEVKK